MTICTNPTKELNYLCQKLGLSDTYAETQRQEYDMSSFLGVDITDVRRMFLSDITEDLESFAENIDNIENHETMGRMKLMAAIAMGFIN